MRALLLSAAVLFLMPAAGLAAAPGEAMQTIPFTASDGTPLYAYVYGAAPLTARPVIYEASTYAPAFDASAGLPFGPSYNYLELHVRGTGRSGGQWDAFGPAEQRDVGELAGIACHAPWSDGRIALTGFSSPAITAYTAMRQRIPCLRAAVLRSGTASLYRDVGDIGGIPHIGVASGFFGLVAAPYAEDLPQRTQDDPDTVIPSITGFAQQAATFLGTQQETSYFTDRDFLHPIDPPSVPILAFAGFNDIEAPSGQEGFWATRALGSHLAIVGGHDASPAGIAEINRLSAAWYAHYLLGAHNTVARGPKVIAWEPVGGYPAYSAGHVRVFSGRDWPLAATRFRPLYLHAGHALGADKPTGSEDPDTFVSTPSNPLTSDPSLPSMFGLIPPGATGDEATEDAKALTYTTTPLASDLDAVGPGALDLRVSTSAAETDLVAVLSDVAPDGTATPISVGRLRTGYSRLDPARSRIDHRSGLMYRPWNVFAMKSPVPPGTLTRYRIPLWPIGNRFLAGHRLRLTLTGTALDDLPTGPAVDTVEHDAARPSRLVLPVLSGRLPA